MGAVSPASPMPAPALFRRLFVLRGPREQTLRHAGWLTGRLDAVQVVDGSRAALGRARQLLGQSLDALILDLHGGLAADTLGICQGLIRGGGALLVCLPDADRAIASAELAVAPFEAADVGTRFWSRLMQHLAQSESPLPDAPLEPPPAPAAGSAEQAEVVATLAQAFSAHVPSAWVLLAERGRGKSSALGLALAAAQARRPLVVWVTAPSRAAAAELLRFAPGEAAAPLFALPLELLGQAGSPDVLVIDEAAQLPVPLLRALTARHPRATLAFSTTTQGYEGTGRGFVLRFLDWLAREPRPLRQLELKQPIRWSAHDPLERFVYDVLALDAEHSPLEALPPTLPEPRRIERDELAHDEALLRSLLGLLIHAHYRTTPGDLERLLDAPNLQLYAMVDGQRVLGATLVALEGGLSRADCQALGRGEWRIRGHALADTLIVHAGYPEVGELQLVRSVRIATHPELRRRGIARRLVEHVHQSLSPDLFGTLFGAVPELLEFRRSLGYSLVRLGSARGSSSGEPSAVMLRAATPRGQALVDTLRADLARDLPLQLELQAADTRLPLVPGLGHALQLDLEPAEPLDAGQIRARVEYFAAGAQTMEAAIVALTGFVNTHPERLARLPERERTLLERRVQQRRSWQDAALAAGYADVPAAMRALRPAIRRLLEASLPGAPA